MEGAQMQDKLTLGELAASIMCDFSRQNILITIIQSFGLGLIFSAFLILIFIKHKKTLPLCMIILGITCYFVPLHFGNDESLLLLTPNFIKNIFIKPTLKVNSIPSVEARDKSKHHFFSKIF